MDIRLITGTVLVIVQALIVLPLILELRKTTSAQGISIPSEVAWIIAGVGWSIYGALTQSTTLVISGALATTGSLLVCILVRSDVEPDTWKRIRIPAAVFTIAMLFCAVIDVTWLSVFLSIFGMVQFIPQITASVQGIRTRTAHGVPLTGTALRAVYTGTWAVYAGAWGLWGIAFDDIDWPLAIWGATGCVAFILQFMSGLRSRPQQHAHTWS